MDSYLGKLLKILPSDAGGFDSNSQVEIIGVGLRSPSRIIEWKSRIFIGDVGEISYEEINVYSKGQVNFGWPICEGPCEGSYQSPYLAIARSHLDTNETKLQKENYRVLDEIKMISDNPDFDAPDDWSGFLRGAISLGVVYDNTHIDRYAGLLEDKLIYNDFFKGYVRSHNADEMGPPTNGVHMFHRTGIVGMDIGPDGYIYGVDFNVREVFRIELKSN